MAEKKLLVRAKPESLSRLNILRVDDIEIPAKLIDINKVYVVLQERKEIQTTVIIDHRGSSPIVKERKDNITLYYTIVTEEGSAEEFLAEDFTVV